MSVLNRIESEVRSGSQDKKLEQLKEIQTRPRSRMTKIIKAGTGRNAAIAVMPEMVDISAPDAPGEEPMGISVVAGAGTVIRGPVNITNRPGEIRIAGFWVLNDLLLSAAPSTIVTPIPVMRFSPPLSSIAKYTASTAVIAAMIGVSQ